MIKITKDFFLESYHSDKVAFYFEMINFLFSVIGSMILSLTAQNPDMEIIYPLFLIGSTAQTYASFRRRASWVMLLTGYFTFTNIFGMFRAFGAI